MKLTLTKKIVLCFLVCAVFVSVFCVSSFADSVTDEDGGVKVATPIFYPEYVVFNDGNAKILCESGTGAALPLNVTTAFLGYTVSETVNVEGNDYGAGSVMKDYTMSMKSEFRTGYSYYYANTQIESYYGDFESAVDGIRLYFNNIWLTPSLAQQTNYNWLGNVDIVTQSTFQPIETTDGLTDVSFNISFIKFDASTGEYSLFNQNYSLSISNMSTGNTRMIMNEIKTFLDSNNIISSDEYKRGVLFNWITVDYIGCTNVGTSGIAIAGQTKHSDPSRRGSVLALDQWDQYISGDVTIIEAPPTVLESITTGLNSIWNLSIFGTFTIGQIFSACVGLTMLTWLLKLFAGG